MSSTVKIAPPRTRLATLPIDQRRGLHGMWATIATEAALFVCMFGAYYYLGANKNRWEIDNPPKLAYPLILLVILLSSSVVLRWGELRVKEERFGAGRIALGITILLGVGFLTLQGFEYSSHWKDLAPYSDSYGSIFYSITTLHAAHVLVGLMMLVYVAILPRWGKTKRSPHQPFATVAVYWHFVDAVWVFIVLLLYVIPNIERIYRVH